MIFTIIGAGAIGSLWAVKLKQVGHQVHFWTRSSAASLTRTLVNYPSMVFQNNQVSALSSSEVIIVCVKAFQVSEALQSVSAHLSSKQQIILMHNGMGTERIASSLLPNHHCLFATTSQASLKHNDTHFSHTGVGHTYIGSIDKSQRCNHRLIETLNEALPKCSWDENIQVRLWQKLAINCMINPITALDNISNGELQSPHYFPLLNALSTEINQVFTALSIDCTCEELLAQTRHVANATAQNFSSMHQDVYFKRPTEIDFITGYLLNTAKHLNISLPHHQALFEKIKQLEP